MCADEEAAAPPLLIVAEVEGGLEPVGVARFSWRNR